MCEGRGSPIRELVKVRVPFFPKDYKGGHRTKTMTVSGEEFLRRFVQHVLPKSFVKVRHYGLLANRHREEKLKTSRRLLMPKTAIEPATTPPSTTPEIVPAPMPHCPKCGGQRFVRRELPETPPIAPPTDTS